MTHFSFFRAAFLRLRIAGVALVPILLTSSVNRATEAAVIPGRRATADDEGNIGTLTMCAASAD
jgi:hypothetical protein